MYRIATAQVWVHDQDEALAFYTQRLGMDVRSDVTVPEMGNFRWVEVTPKGQPEMGIVLMAVPGPPLVDDATREDIRTLMGKGFAGTVFLETDDIHATVAELIARGVEFIDMPFDTPYGIDSSFRDPSGNNFRLTQRAAGY